MVSVVTRSDVDWQALDANLVLTTIAPQSPAESVIVIQPFLTEADIDRVRKAASRIRRLRRRAALKSELLQFFDESLFEHNFHADDETEIRALGYSRPQLSSSRSGPGRHVWLTQDIRHPGCPPPQTSAELPRMPRPGQADLLSWPRHDTPLPDGPCAPCGIRASTSAPPATSPHPTLTQPAPNQFDGDFRPQLPFRQVLGRFTQNLRRIRSGRSANPHLPPATRVSAARRAERG